MMPREFTIEGVRQQEAELVLDRFDEADAWKLGSLITEAAIAAEASVAIDIRRGDRILFRAMLPGTTVDQEFWLRGKAALAQRFECSSMLTAWRLEGVEVSELVRLGLDPSEYAISGGSFPIRVRGAGVVAVGTASGLSQEADHMLIVSGIRALSQ